MAQPSEKVLHWVNKEITRPTLLRPQVGPKWDNKESKGGLLSQTGIAIFLWNTTSNSIDFIGDYAATNTFAYVKAPSDLLPANLSRNWNQNY